MSFSELEWDFHYLCLFAYSGIQHILCCVFTLFVFVLCTQCILQFPKTFDKVSNNLLIHKLKHYGIRGKVNNWIESFLSGRSHCWGWKIYLPPCRFWSAPGLGPWTKSVLILHKWHSHWTRLHNKTLCRWHNCIPGY